MTKFIPEGRQVDPDEDIAHPLDSRCTYGPAVWHKAKDCGIYKENPGRMITNFTRSDE